MSILLKKKKLNVSIKKCGLHNKTGTVVPKQGQLKWANACFSVSLFLFVYSDKQEIELNPLREKCATSQISIGILLRRILIKLIGSRL